MLPYYIHCLSQIYNFPDEMDDIRLAGLSISVRNVEISSMTSDPAIAIIFADPLLQDLERMILYDETLQAIIAKILANNCDDDLVDCRHLFKADLIPRKLEEKTDDQKLKEEKNVERSSFGDLQDQIDDYGDQEESTRLSVDEKKEGIETKSLSGSCEKTSWPYKKVSIFKLFKSQYRYLYQYRVSQNWCSDYF
jgi:hypothetical protein